MNYEEIAEPDENTLSLVDSGLDRLSYALHARLERYKVELFIHLCEMLEEDGDDGEEGEGESYDQNSY